MNEEKTIAIKYAKKDTVNVKINEQKKNRKQTVTNTSETCNR